MMAGFTGPLFFAFGNVKVDVDDSSIWLTLTGGTEDPQMEPAFVPAFTLWLEDLHWVGFPDFVIDQVIPSPNNTANVSVDQVGPHEIHFSFPGFTDPTGSMGFIQEAHFDITHRLPEPGAAALLLVSALALYRLRR